MSGQYKKRQLSSRFRKILEQSQDDFDLMVRNLVRMALIQEDVVALPAIRTILEYTTGKPTEELDIKITDVARIAATPEGLAMMGFERVKMIQYTEDGEVEVQEVRSLMSPKDVERDGSD